MKAKTIEIFQISLVILATIVLIVMNAVAFSSVTLLALRVLLACCWIGFGVLVMMTRKVRNSKG